MSEIPTEEIIITNQLPTKATFAVSAERREQVYIPASIGHACEMTIGKSYQAVLVPNGHENADKTPWMAVRVVGCEDEPKATQRAAEAFSDVSEALAEAEYPLTTEETGLMRHRLERAWRAGKVVKVEARRNPQDEPKVLWTLDLELV